MLRFFAKDNHYGSQTSEGFGNTYYVLAFDSKAARDAYVESRREQSIAAGPVLKKDVTTFVSSTPRRYSTEYYGIADVSGRAALIDGCIGYVEVYNDDNAERLY